MTIAIYSRKSKITETGDSIQNQKKICRDYAKQHFADCNFLEYEDEGFSGGNVDRPMFQKLLKDIKNNKINVLICYRLDRISRNINDFSHTLEILDRYNVGFASVTEQFDTTTPMGKAMMYIASVFAQLERDTTAQRIIDNFTELSKTGRYLLGSPPEGFRKKKITDSNGKYYNVLEVVPEEAEKIKLIYNLYLQWNSITKIETYCIQNNIKNKNGAAIAPDWISRILRHQLYVTADQRVYEYFKNLGAHIASPKEMFDGQHGITVYRRMQKGRRSAGSESPPERLIISVGQHEGIISSTEWIEVQNIILQRKDLWKRNPTGYYGMLNGILYCASCGSLMKPASIKKNGQFHYVCKLKEKSRKQQCEMQNLSHTIDYTIIDIIKEKLLRQQNYNETIISKKAVLDSAAKSNANREQIIRKKISANDKAVSSLVRKLLKIDSDILIEKVDKEVRIIEEESKKLKKELIAIIDDKEENETNLLSLDIARNALSKMLSDNFNSKPTLEKRIVLKTIVDKAIWNGENLEVIISPIYITIL